LKQLAKVNTDAGRNWYQPWGHVFSKHIEPVQVAEDVISRYTNRTGARVTENPKQQGPEYRNDMDKVFIPPRWTFDSMPWFYCGLFHELAHSTGRSDRLNRVIDNPFGTRDYAIEEMTADVAADFVMCDLGLMERKMLENTGYYLNDWIGQLFNPEACFMEYLTDHQSKEANLNSFDAYFERTMIRGRQAADYLLDN
jgi:antirestriction protein ArdC